jgi:glutathione S-transferase
MKLYFSPGACSLSPHIVLREAGLDFEAVKVSLGTHTLGDGSPFDAVNPKGYVPALVLDDGLVLTEGPAIVQYLADQKPELHLAPPAGTIERYQLMSWLNYIATELHKQFSPLFDKSTPPEIRASQVARLTKRLALVDEQLSKHPYLMGELFTVADAYLFTVLRWTKLTGPDLTQWPAIVAFNERVGARPAVLAALEAEGLVKKPAA